MRHRKAALKLNRTPSHRKAMFRNMVTSLFKYERIQTTETKAKELRRWADQLITLAKRGDLHARRQALAIMREKDVVHKLFEQAAERYGAVSGGYTRVVKLGHRPGDAAPVSLVELIYSQDTKKKKTKKKTKAKAKDDTVKSTVKPASKKKAAADEKEKKTVTKAAAEKKTTAQAKSAETEKEDKPKKKVTDATKKGDAADTKKKKAPAKKAPKDA